MSISLKQIAGNTASVSFSIATESGPERVTIVYLPSMVTERTFAQLQNFDAIKIETISESFSDLNDILCRLIKSWDVYDDEAQTTMFPLDPARMGELPITFRMKVLDAVLVDIRPEAGAA